MSNKQETKLFNGYWVNQTNKWDASIYTEDQAKKCASKLINCHNCINCSGCSGCNNCNWCINCRNCIICHGCFNCNGCTGCINCSDCIICRNCSDCINCFNCIICIICFDCRKCSGCINCIDFITNPERITSPFIGSTNDQITYYWNEEKDQIVSKSFKGTLKEFKAKIKEYHGNNKHAQAYFKWIEKIKIYKQ